MMPQEPRTRTCEMTGSALGVTFWSVAVPGASLWRFWIESSESRSVGFSPIIITPHIFKSAEEALDAADLWCASTTPQRRLLERQWNGQ